MDEAGRCNIFEVLSDGVVILAFNRPATTLLSYASMAFLLDDQALRGIGTPQWFASNKTEICNRLQLLGETDAQEDEQGDDVTADDF